MLLDIFFIITGLIALGYSADKFVYGASSIAAHLGISPLLIGLTIVAFGTSAPEIFVSISAAIDNKTDLAIGNAIGSNIANTALVLGVAIIFTSKFITVSKAIIKNELSIMLIITFVCAFILFDGYLSQIESIFLLTSLLCFMLYAIYQGKNASRQETNEPEAQIKLKPASAWFWLILGLISMALCSELLVWSASNIAVSLGVSNLVIGLTVVAIGTSLPEVAASIASALKNESELAVGNIIGSNIFNLLAVIGVAGFITPSNIDAIAITRDIPALLLISLLLLVLVKPWHLFNESKPHQLFKFSGILLLLVYITYIFTVVITST